MVARARIDHRSIAMLGLLTICAYGSWYYAFGVLLDPIRDDTGWSESALAASFSVGTALIGLAALFGGRHLDRVGHRQVFVLGGVAGALALTTASVATSLWLFFVGAALGMAAFGTLGFYHVTMTVAVRLHPQDSTRAIAALTVWGALASAIFLPLSEWLEGELGWRATTRVLGLITGAVFLLAAAVIPAPSSPQPTRRVAVREILRSLVAERGPRLFTTAVAFGGIAMATLLVYQVPVMTAAGLPKATAASMAGLRGLFQLAGRLPLTPVVRWLGRSRALAVALAAITVGSMVLIVAGSVPVAVAFAVVAGFGIGAFSPLQGMKAQDLFSHDRLGATMGAYGAVLVLAGSCGPLLAGVVAEQTGERRWAAVIAAVAAAASCAATAALLVHERAAGSRA